MKEKTLTSDAGEVAVEEKSAFDKFNDDIKMTVFNVLYVLLNEEEDGSNWSTVINIFLDFMQIWNLSFADVFSFPWKGQGITNIMQSINDVQSIVWWVAKIDFLTFIICFYICTFIIFLVLMDIFYVSYSFTKKKFPFVWPLRVLRSVCSLFVTSLFMPILGQIYCYNKIIEEFFSIIHCKSPPPGSSKPPENIYMDLFPDVQCWVGAHIIHACISIVVTVVFISICLVVSFMFYECNGNSRNIEAKINSRTDTFLTFMKIMLTLVSMFFAGEKNHWFSIAMLNIFGIIAYYKYKTTWPYYNENMNKFYCSGVALFVWANFCLFLCKILEQTQFNGGLQIYFFGIPVIAGIIWLENDRRVELLCKNITYFQKGEDYGLQVRYFLHLVKSRYKDKKCNALLNGFIFFHEDTCLYNDCQLKQYKKQIQSSKSKIGTSKTIKATEQNFDLEQLLLQHVTNMYKLGIKQFPDSTALKIQFALFLVDFMNKRNEGLSLMNEVEKQKPPPDEQFLIFRYKKIFEEVGEGRGEAEDEGLDVVSMLAYESNLKLFQESILKSGQLHLNFWNQLQQEMPDIKKLNSVGEKINNSVFLVESYWDKLQKLNANKPKALKMYARFLIEILNDKERGEELVNRANEASNIKNNYNESNVLQRGITDISTSSNGAPCIQVSGDSVDFGRITNCNASACFLFGYIKEELCNFHVDRLMPEMYTKNHTKLLDEAVSNNTLNVHSKERLVFAKHKSGYIFPVRLQVKMISSAQYLNRGVNFIALFKLDKKQISSNIAYVLINKQKELQNISSSFMTVLNIDMSKVKRLSTSSLNIKQLAPKLFQGNTVDEIYSSRQGGQIEWYMPNFDLLKKHYGQRQSLRQKLSVAVYSSLRLSKDRQVLNCHVSPITMSYFGEIGWIIKLSRIANQDSPRNQARMDVEYIKQPLFQFRYDERTGRFIRELRDHLSIENAGSNPRFVDGFWTEAAQMTQVIEAEENSANKVQEQSQGDKPIQDEQIEVPETKAEDTNNLFAKKRAWGDKIQTYRLQEGKFVVADFDLEFKKQKELEKKTQQQAEDDFEEQKEGQKHNMQQKRQLQAAIKNKKTPSSIIALRIVMTSFIVALIGLAVTLFVIMNEQFKDVNENFQMIYYSRSRITEIQRIAYDVRTLILINRGNLTIYPNYTTSPDFIQYIKDDLQNSLNSLFQIQSKISSSKLNLNPQLQDLNDNKVVHMYFQQYNGSKTYKLFSLTDAVLQYSSAAFALEYMNLTSFNDNQEDAFLIIQNAYSDFLIDLKLSATLYLAEIYQQMNQKEKTQEQLVFTSLAILVVFTFLLYTMTNKVSIFRVQILALFIDIPEHSVIHLSVKCENFIQRCQQEEQYDDNDAKEEEAKDEETLLSQSSKKKNSKMVRKLIQSNFKVLTQFIIALLTVIAYFLGMYFMSTDQLTKIKVYSKEMNNIAQAEQYFLLSQNILRESIYEPAKDILNISSNIIAIDTISKVYNFNFELMSTHQRNQGTFNSEYQKMFEDIYRGDLCNKDISAVKQDLLPFPCQTFLSSAPLHVTNLIQNLTHLQGLQTVLVNYFQDYEVQLSKYYSLRENGKSINGFFDSIAFRDLYIIQQMFIKDSFRKLVSTLMDNAEVGFNNRITIRIACFTAFIVIMLFIYIAVWIPFINQLLKEVSYLVQQFVSIDIKDEADAVNNTNGSDTEDTQNTNVSTQLELFLKVHNLTYKLLSTQQLFV